MDLASCLEGPHEAVLLRTIAYQCKPLIVSGSSTLKLKHLLYVVEKVSQCPVVAVEVYLYLTCHNGILHRHFFVSKADTTGLGTNRASIAGVVSQFLKYLLLLSPHSYIANAKWRKTPRPVIDEKPESEFSVVNTLLQLSSRLKSEPTFYDSLLYYGKREHFDDVLGQEQWTYNSIETSLSLFTRSAGSYIFPRSDRNTTKHLTDGNQLFKWWILVLLKTLDDSWTLRADIPGSNSRDVSRFFPKNSNWSVGNIYDGSINLAVFCIPVFPDDPKGRFLEHLVVEGRYKNTSTEQFWNELGFRQEFRLGNTVGIIGCVQKAQCDLIAGDRDTVVTLKTYKKVLESIKGEDYSAKDDIQSFMQSGLPETYRRCGINVKPISVYGIRIPYPIADDLSVLVLQRGVNDSSASVKKGDKGGVLNVVARKRDGTNDLNGLVKKKPKVNDAREPKERTANLAVKLGTRCDVGKRNVGVNDMGGLVKREKPFQKDSSIESERVNDLTILVRRNKN